MKSKNWLSDKEYDFIYSRAPRLCVDLFIKNKNGILLTKRSIEPYKNTWHLPGGRVKFKESIFGAVARISRAEIGVSAKIEKFIGYVELPREIQNGRPRHSVSLVFLIKVDIAKIKSDWQATEIKFFKSLPANITGPHGKFLKANKYLK
jgi:ADP-ribose pyrophosphatase YjhB (NUDIX family)